jgi:signal transduction histidine kinase
LIRSRFVSVAEYGIVILTFAFLAVYGFVLLSDIPYLGFLYEPDNGLTTVLYRGSNSPEALLSGDYLKRVNAILLDDVPADTRQAVLSAYHAGNQLTLEVSRGTDTLIVQWIVPGINFAEFFYRLGSAWWLPFAFWLAGVVTILLVRPKETRRLLLIAYFFLLAIAVSAGAISAYGKLYSSEVMHSIVWLLIPVSFHLHWLFPSSLGNTPNRVLWGLYVLAGLMAIAEWFGVLPSPAYMIGFLLALVNSAVLLSIHAITQPDQRRGALMLLGGLFLVALPTIMGVVVALLTGGFPTFVNYSVFFLPVMVVFYFYIIYQGDAQGMELRANRLITIIIYGGILLAVSVLLAFVAAAFIQDSEYYLSIGVALALLVGMITVYLYPTFQSVLERRLLGIPVPATMLLEQYSTRMTASLGQDDLVHLLRDEALPSMLIRQAALIRLNISLSPTTLFTLGIDQDQLPSQEQMPTLLSQAGVYPRIAPDSEDEFICPWALLVLTLSVSGQVVGLGLFGKRDPDDEYTKSEIRTLQALMDQTALALVNIDQAVRLRALYQKDIERQEMERSHLARELHDDVLNQLGILYMSVDERQAGEQFTEAYQTSVSRIREIISGLRPGMLMYGLRFALEELTEETATQVGGDIAIQLEIPPSDSRYPPDVELHLFRIVQQACQNALKHSQAQCIYLRGELDHGLVELIVEDDGVGFMAGEHLDLARLLANKHYGLAGMHERAALIGAKMQIDSATGKGTRVRVIWKPEFPVPQSIN